MGKDSGIIHYIQLMKTLCKLSCISMRWKFVILLDPIVSSTNSVNSQLITFCCNYYNRHAYKGCYYFSLGNIPPKYRSKLNSIQLVPLIKVGLQHTYGIDCVMRKIIEDVKVLEEVP